ncbi:MAG: DinB family protein [Chitinophagaceae bacterium]|nr:MAG: DinB family protein [Chitinophagaceae bacterium]
MIASALARQVREFYFGGNWTESSLFAVLSDVDWALATAVGKLSANSIAALTYHIHFYVAAQRKVLEGGPLESSDRDAFALPPLAGEADWQALQTHIKGDAEALATLIEALPEERLDEHFVAERYGSYYRNIAGMIEHSYYHLGQIVFLKKELQYKS